VENFTLPYFTRRLRTEIATPPVAGGGVGLGVSDETMKIYRGAVT
jgi:hypothetical protein